MSNPFYVENIKDTNSIISAALNGTSEFVLKNDDVNNILDKYGLNIESIKSLVKSNYQEWFDIANDKTSKHYKEITKFLKSFINRIEVIKTQNKNLYKEMIKIFLNNQNMTNEEIMEFKWPELKFDDDKFEIS